MGLTETVASLISCLPVVSTMVPFIDPVILLFVFPELFNCEKADNPVSNEIEKNKRMRMFTLRRSFFVQQRIESLVSDLSEKRPLLYLNYNYVNQFVIVVVEFCNYAH